MLEYIVDGDSDKKTGEGTVCSAVFCCSEVFGIRLRFMCTFAFYRATFLGDPQKIPPPLFLDQRNKENNIGSASGVCAGQSKINVE